MPSCMRDLSSLTRDVAHTPVWKLGVLTLGPPGKSLQTDFLTLKEVKKESFGQTSHWSLYFSGIIY